MSIESSIQRIVDAKTAIISAINEQLNGETVPDDIKVQGLAAYIISACEIQYNLGLGGGGNENSITVSADWGTISGTYYADGTKNGQSVYVKNNEYWVYYNGYNWELREYGQEGGSPPMANNSSSDIESEWNYGVTVTLNGSGGQAGESSSSSESGGGQGGGGTRYIVSGPEGISPDMDGLQGIYEPYNKSGYGGTQTYKYGNYYMYMFMEDDPGWCIMKGSIGSLTSPSGPPTGSLIWCWTSSTDPSSGLWTSNYTVIVAS